MVVRHTVDKQPLGGYGKFRERVRKSKVSENAPLGSGQHPGERDRKKGRRKVRHFLLRSQEDRPSGISLWLVRTAPENKKSVNEKYNIPLKE